MELTLEQQVDRLWDVQQLRNLIGKYQYLLTAHEHAQVYEMFSKRDDIYMDCEGMGILDGPLGVRKFFIDWHQHQDGDSRGQFNTKTITTDLIEVADDGLTAFALWKGPGYETRKKHDGSSEVLHLWGIPAIDFIKEDGEWKIWHLRLPHSVLCDYHRSWVDLDDGKRVMGVDGELKQSGGKPKGDRPSGFRPNFYSQDIANELTFELPVPYGTYEELEQKGFWAVKTFTNDGETAE